MIFTVLKNLYSRVAFFWGWAFVLAGLAFIIIPNEVVGFLNQCGDLLGLSGKILAENGGLWHVLTISLMACISLISLWSSKHPKNKGFLYALLLAKSTSVLGFLWLSFYSGTVWILGAVTDGFIAITLFLSFKSMADIQVSVPGFSRLYKNQKPFYEVWFGKIDVSPNRAFWFRYTILNGVSSEANTWAIYFDENDIVTGKKSIPVTNLSPCNTFILDSGISERILKSGHSQQVFHCGGDFLNGHLAMGKAGKIFWDLQYENMGCGFEHVPPLMKMLKLAKSNYFATHLDLRFNGKVNINGKEIPLKDNKGMIGHISGKKSAHCWAWAHCNNFEQEGQIVFEGLSAKIKLGSWISPELTSLVFIRNGQLFSFSSTRLLFKNKSDFKIGLWSFSAKSKDAELRGKATAGNPMAVVQYTDTDDSKQWCYNSKLASLNLEFKDLKSGKTEIFTSTGTTAFEVVNRNTPDQPIDL